MREKVDKDKKLTFDENKSLRTYLVTINDNIVSLNNYYESIFKVNAKNGKLIGFWTALKAIFSNVWAAVTTIVIIGVAAVLGLVGGPWGVVAGVVIGAIAAYTFTCDWFLNGTGPIECDDCANFSGSAQHCDNCKTLYPTYTFTCDL
jgi:hypothetical protein